MKCQRQHRNEENYISEEDVVGSHGKQKVGAVKLIRQLLGRCLMRTRIYRIPAKMKKREFLSKRKRERAQRLQGYTGMTAGEEE